MAFVAAGYWRQLGDPGQFEDLQVTLHDVRNVLNSINVTATCLRERLQGTREAKLLEAANLLMEQGAGLQDFLASDARGQQFPRYLKEVARHLVEKNLTLRQEAERLLDRVEHLKAITSPRNAGLLNARPVKECAANELMEEAWQIAVPATSPQIRCIRRYQSAGVLPADRHQVVQILVNLIKNAQEAMGGHACTDKTITLIIDTPENDKVAFTVEDNGEGVSKANQARLFELGFTTKPKGQGVGLRGCATVALQLGGTLTCHSAGAGCGARFTLTLPTDSIDNRIDHDLVSPK